MKYPSRIFLVGFMGTGKTVVGKNLAKKLKMKFIDVDVKIENKTGKTVDRIFKEDGEKRFRKYETEVLKELVKNNNIVVATGGGIALSLFNRRLMKKKGIVIGLSASASEILKRVRKETHRPLLEGHDKFNRIKELFKKRKKYYNEVSDCIIDTDNLSVKKITSSILNSLRSIPEFQGSS